MLAATAKRTRLSSVPLAVLLVVSAASLTAGQEGGTPLLETRVFDIRSLLLDVPDYRAIFSDLRSDDLYGSGIAGPTGITITKQGEGQGLFKDAPSRGREANAQILMEMVESVVIGPCQVAERGGGLGNMHYYAGQLVVCDQPQVILEIEKFLDMLKASAARKVQIDADFVIVPRKEPEQGAVLEAVLEEWLQREVLQPEEFRKLLDSKKGQVDVTHVTVSGFDGQRVATTSGTQTNFVAGMIACVQERVSAYEPQLRQVVEGVTFEAQPVLDKERNVVLVDVRASLGHVLPREQGKAADAPRTSAEACAAKRGEAGSTTRPAGSGQESAGALLLQALAAAADVERGVSPGQVDKAFSAMLEGPEYQVAHFATSVALPVDAVSLVGAARYDEQHDVLLWIRPSIR
jgi:hypothetical protein